jgi:putative membrane protein
MHFITQTLVTAFSLILIARVLPGITFSGLGALIITAVVLGILNALVRPLLVILTLPITIVTLGLFLFVINGILLYATSLFVSGFAVANLFTAVVASLAIAVISFIVHRFI